MEERRGNGIFLGVVSVATLIVAIIGATFAYFSASTQSADNAVSLQAYEFKMDLDMEQIYPNPEQPASGLIPLKGLEQITADENTLTSLGDNSYNLFYALNVAENKCVDDNGLQVCALYKVTIENTGRNPMTLTGLLETTANNAKEGEEDATPFANLSYLEIGGNETEGFTKITDKRPQTLGTEVGNSISISSIDVTAATVDPVTGEVDTPGSGVGYVLIYLNDHENQSGEMGAIFEGKVIYSSGGEGGNALTGTFKVGGQQADQPSGEPSGESSGETGE